ncbi:TPM domain-containing protein [Vulcaniibacterium thermophilum]|uniref:Membrane protein n=1 Tax=Vulcaniibacterium thermophilum TaxID=1169913 RepID=A0A918YV04_9GAMM|nr:TPM domain-containing protein [Vulcaniibacterium thermophilum]GHE24713.1 membrane protein [Vulcaniibacterium thermophilum]
MRLLRHLFPPSVARRFPEASLARITEAIAAGERRHTGEVCFAVEAALPLAAAWAGVDARQRACEVFAQLRVWDTEANNGVLLYLLLADHRIEIVADRGFRGRVDDAHWTAICRGIEARLRRGEYEAGVLHGIAALHECVATHFPRIEGASDPNELPDRPHIL